MYPMVVGGAKIAAARSSVAAAFPPLNFTMTPAKSLAAVNLCENEFGWDSSTQFSKHRSNDL